MLHLIILLLANDAYIDAFAVVQGTNVSFTYCIDAYRPIAGEVTVTQLAFKCKLLMG
jgi:hypothetical protein